jgi:hypothetical protein
VQFWRFTARTFKQGVRMLVQDGAATVLDGNDWEHPPVAEFSAPPFFVFGSALSYECTYQNQSGRTVMRGASEDFDEVCLAIGWFFPATRPSYCYNSIGPL